jgi:hypothetical protein
MRFVIDCYDAIGADMDVFLCSGEALMPQKLLNTPQVCAVIQEVCGKSMAQGMGASAGRDACTTAMFSDQPMHTA